MAHIIVVGPQKGGFGKSATRVAEAPTFMGWGFASGRGIGTGVAGLGF